MLFERLCYLVSILILLILRMGFSKKNVSPVIMLFIFLFFIQEVSIGTICDSCSRSFRKGGSDESFIEGMRILYFYSSLMVLALTGFSVWKLIKKK